MNRPQWAERNRFVITTVIISVITGAWCFAAIWHGTSRWGK